MNSLKFISFKILLNECFSEYSWKDVIKKYPQISNLIKNDPLFKEKGEIGEGNYTPEELDNIDTLAWALAYGGGACGYNFEDFSPKKRLAKLAVLTLLDTRIIMLSKLIRSSKTKLVMHATKEAKKPTTMD